MHTRSPATQPPGVPPACPSRIETGLTWDLFCRVIDNHGDLGVCWRLARDLAHRGHTVRLWVDDASALSWMAPAGAPGVQVLPWNDEVRWPEPAEVIVEAFGCDLPQGFVAAMRQRSGRGAAPVWINLEYLSAEAYVERSHALPSPQMIGPGQGLTKWFFYPGFTVATGGLLREQGLVEDRDRFQGEAGAREAFLHQRIGRTDFQLRRDSGAQPETLVLLFGYAQPALPAWLSASMACLQTVLVTPGYSSREVARWLGLAASPTPGSTFERGLLRLVFLPPVEQPEFDLLLWSCDLNLVRGEDSAVRALWAGRPFVWQLYVQDEAWHLAKLEAFLVRYLQGAPADVATRVGTAFRRWNNGMPNPVEWPLPRQAWSGWQEWAGERSRQWAEVPDLTTQLLAFVRRQALSNRLASDPDQPEDTEAQ